MKDNLEVIIYPSSNSTHLLQIYTGLALLTEDELISTRLSLKPLFEHEIGDHILGILLIDKHKNISKKIIFDMGDSGEIKYKKALKNSDIYFKRSYHISHIENIPSIEKSKILPFGFNYCCISKHDLNIFKRLVTEFWAKKRNILNNPKSIISLVKYSLRLYGSHKGVLNNDYRRILLDDEFEYSPSNKKTNKILFQTRLWDHQNVPSMHKDELDHLNHSRAELVQLLKNNYKQRFIGGLQQSDTASKHYPHLLATSSTAQNDYINLVKDSEIAITTTGLFQSNGWKLPEYLASSCCVITEPIYFKTPLELKEKTNILTFKTPFECLENIAILDEDEELRNNMMKSNFDYFKNQIHPKNLMHNCLEKALTYSLE